MSMMYKSEIPGQNKLWFGPSYNLLKAFDMQLLRNATTCRCSITMPSMSTHRNLQLFSNKDRKYPEDHHAYAYALAAACRISCRR